MESAIYNSPLSQQFGGKALLPRNMLWIILMIGNVPKKVSDSASIDKFVVACHITECKRTNIFFFGQHRVG